MLAAVNRHRVRDLLARYLEAPSARLLQRVGLSPNAVSLLGFAVAVGAAYLVGAGSLLWGGVVFLAAGLFDLLDGALARQSGQVSPFGALLDSLLDRLGEAALLLGLTIWAVRTVTDQGQLLALLVLLVLALVSSQTVSYLRARGEGLGIGTDVGWMTRPERVLILSAGLALQGVTERGLWVALAAVALFSFITLVQRLWHLWRHTGGSEPQG
ncbi:MAG: CDP-alcohol phosphatidyltransferase family protein [Dehalococcoidia bacterium]